MENNKFIDLNGLELIWSKIDNSLTEVNTKIKELTNEVTILKKQVDSMRKNP